MYDEGGMNDLGTLDGVQSSAMGINDRGEISGMYRTQQGSYHVFIFDELNGMQDVGSLDGNIQYVSVLSSRGQLVGFTFPFGLMFISTSRPYVYDPMFGFRDLNDLLDDDAWTIYTAYDINSHGQIVGTGSYNGGYRQAFIMTPNSELNPVPEPSTILLLGGGLAGLGFYRRR